MIPSTALMLILRMVNSKYTFVLCVMLSACVVNSAVLRDKLFPLDIIHYNDFHDRFEETSVLYAVCQTNDTSCIGGFARLTYEIKALLIEKPNALLLNAGDAFQGTYWYALMKWNVTQHFLNMLPHDAHTIGNHEFDDGIEGVAPFLAALKAPVVAANLDNSNEPLLHGLYIPHVVVERNGRKIGIIGVSTEDSKILSRPRNLIFLDPVKVVLKEAKSLTERGVDIIVVLSHCGLDIDKVIAKAAGESVDVIVGGHSHSLLWNGPSPSKESVAGPYPVLVESESKPGHKVLIVQASAYTKYLGNITIYFDSQGELVSFDAAPVFLNRSIPEDPEIKALLQPYTTKLHSFVNEVVGYANDNLISHKCNRMECALGNIIADAYLEGAKQAFPSNLTNVAFILKQTMRASLSKGNITRGDLINLSPFTNKVVSVVTAGRYLWQALEMCMTFWWSEKPFRSPYMPSVAGMQVTLNTTSRKVVSVLVNRGETGFTPLELDQDYQVTIIDFMYNGGSGFDMFMKNGRDLKIVGTDSEVVEKHVKKITPLNDKLDNRLIVIT